ncbi:MAG: ATP-binding cassette domain-containing protein, partial [Oscillospiraceae bacterium]
MALLRFCKLSFAYPNANVRTLDNISLDIEDGEYIVLCGPSGCGKTTLLRHAKPELIPVGAVEGITEYQGNQISKISPFIAANEIGFVQQNPDSQIVTDFVWHELAFGLENMGLSTSAIRRRVAEMAAFFGMETWFRKKTTEISGGQKQLLNLASVMAMAPRLLILDEPTAMLDPLAARTLLDTIKRINKELGVAVLLTEHRLEEVFPVADKVVLMDKGKILSCGLPENIAKTLSNSKDRSRLYFGLPAAARIGGALGCKCTPITVRDGRRELKKFLDENEIVIQKIEPSTIEKLHKNYSVKKSVVLEGNNVWFRYEENGADILRGLSLELLKGDVLCLLGGNGSGKTTLMKLLAGIKKPYRGKVKIAKDSKLCMLPQNPLSLFTYDTLERELLESADGDNDRAKELAQRLELTGLLKHHPYDLSGGEVQRAAIA